jgi:hypothetical protein
MEYIEAPQPYERRPGDHPSIFLAGGITACEDWQLQVRTRLADAPVVLFNPRRSTFDLARPDNAAEQVAWEYRHLRLAQLTLFWFPACDPRVTVQPITLLELGTALAEVRLIGRKIAVGADPGYPRRLDLELQIGHAVPDLPLHDTLADTVAAGLRRLGL